MSARCGGLRRSPLRRVLAIALPPLLLALLVAASAPSVGCRGVEVRVPARGPDGPEASEWTCVDYPPLAAKVEELPAPPNAASVWVDGEWSWNRKRWSWRPGGWLEPAGGSHYLRSAVVRLPNGALAWHAGHWRLDIGDGGADSSHEASAAPAPASASAFASVALRCRRPAILARESAPSSSVDAAFDAAPTLEGGREANALAAADAGANPLPAADAPRPWAGDAAPEATDVADAGRAMIQPPP